MSWALSIDAFEYSATDCRRARVADQLRAHMVERIADRDSSCRVRAAERPAPAAMAEGVGFRTQHSAGVAGKAHRPLRVEAEHEVGPVSYRACHRFERALRKQGRRAGARDRRGI